jgi:hypothetical protein
MMMRESFEMKEATQFERKEVKLALRRGIEPHRRSSRRYVNAKSELREGRHHDGANRWPAPGNRQKPYPPKRVESLSGRADAWNRVMDLLDVAEDGEWLGELADAEFGPLAWRE